MYTAGINRAIIKTKKDCPSERYDKPNRVNVMTTQLL